MDELRTAIASEATLGSGLMRPGTATADPAIPTIEGAYRSLEAWGFLAQPDLPDLPGPAFLLVALRPSPSLRHFDPELVRYWTVAAGRGHLEELTRRSTFPLYRPFAWGSIELGDRLGVTNDYLTFGGELTGAVVDDTAILMFTSPAPLCDAAAIRRDGMRRPTTWLRSSRGSAGRSTGTPRASRTSSAHRRWPSTRRSCATSWRRTGGVTRSRTRIPADGRCWSTRNGVSAVTISPNGSGVGNCRPISGSQPPDASSLGWGR